jgi:hypothetical protein
MCIPMPLIKTSSLSTALNCWLHPCKRMKDLYSLGSRSMVVVEGYSFLPRVVTRNSVFG